MSKSTSQISPSSFECEGQIVNLVAGTIFGGRVTVSNGKIKSIERCHTLKSQFILPLLVNSHVHVESSMLVPSQFGPACLAQGIGATVSDPHEIANVLGVPGVEFMLENAQLTPLRIHFGAPSCVPATNSGLETSGAIIDSSAVEKLLARPNIHYLTEMMNFPGVLNGDSEVMAKIAAAKRLGKPIDGHAPGLRGDDARRYAAAGITTDHECVSYDEAKEKYELGGMKILIREGSAAKNFEALAPLINEIPHSVMFCSDDLHPDELLSNNIDLLVRRAISGGVTPMTALRAATLNPVKHYNLSLGLLQVGDRADFFISDSLTDLHAREVYLDGKCVSKDGESISTNPAPVLSTPNNFHAKTISAPDLLVPRKGNTIRVIEVTDGQLVTTAGNASISSQGDFINADPDNDLVKLVVVNRYSDAKPAVAFVRNTGIKKGAIASCVAHDCHNIIAAGVNDTDIAAAINLVISSRGGISLACDSRQEVFPLPVAGIMANCSASEAAQRYSTLDKAAKSLCGSTLKAPFMTLSFLALLVIPELKLSDKGLFDGRTFKFIPLAVS